jgi:hypothetical protein
VKDGRNLEFWAAFLFLAATLITCLACTQILNHLCRRWNRGNEWKERDEVGLLKVDGWERRRRRDRGLRPLLMAVGCVLGFMFLTIVWLPGGRGSDLVLGEA